MKSKILTLLTISLLSVITVYGQNNTKKSNPVGTWKFEAPYAREGYTSGTIIVGQADQIYTTTISFTGNENKLTGDKVKFEKDSLLFSVYIEGEDVKILIKVENEAKMSGKAIYSEGEVLLTLTKKLNMEQQ